VAHRDLRDRFPRVSLVIKPADRSLVLHTRSKSRNERAAKNELFIL
jgi:hypothetical protein